MATTSPLPDLDRATRTVSCFPSFAALTADMDRTGYFPTIRADRLFSRKPEIKAQALLLRKALHDSGRKAFPNWGEYKGEQ